MSFSGRLSLVVYVVKLIEGKKENMGMFAFRISIMAIENFPNFNKFRNKFACKDKRVETLTILCRGLYRSSPDVIDEFAAFVTEADRGRVPLDFERF